MGTVDVNFSLLQTSKYLKSHKDNFFKIMKVFANITQIILTDSPKKPKGHTKDYTIEGHTLFTFFSEIHPIQGTKDKSASRQYQLFISHVDILPHQSQPREKPLFTQPYHVC